MFAVGNTMKLQHRNAPVFGLADGAFEIFQRPAWPRVACRRNQQRMILSRLESESAALVVRKFGRSTAPGESETEVFQDFQSVRSNRVAGISKRSGTRDAMVAAAGVDRL